MWTTSGDRVDDSVDERRSFGPSVVWTGTVGVSLNRCVPNAIRVALDDGAFRQRIDAAEGKWSGCAEVSRHAMTAFRDSDGPRHAILYHATQQTYLLRWRRRAGDAMNTATRRAARAIGRLMAYQALIRALARGEKRWASPTRWVSGCARLIARNDHEHLDDSVHIDVDSLCRSAIITSAGEGAHLPFRQVESLSRRFWQPERTPP